MLARILFYYFRTQRLKERFTSREQLQAYQNKQFQVLVKNTLRHAPFYNQYLNLPFQEWPIINKQIMNEHFDAINTVRLKKADALNCALLAEETRDFTPLIDSVSVGLSSGTSGQRGLFLASSRERDAWAGCILAKMLPNGLRTKERIAFFLRANSPIYTTINKSRKIAFHFFDLLDDFDQHIARLNTLKPTIVSAPASVLKALALQKKQLTFQPRKICSVAEVLEPTDEDFISSTFGLPVAQVYQATEGFLAASDKITNQLVLNEEFLIVEKEWIDEHRFVPVITDLMRRTQPIVRYRLDDVLVIKKPSGVFTELSAIEGRLGDVCYGKQGADLVPIFADTLRQYMARSPIAFNDYFICQKNLSEFSIQVSPEVREKQRLIDHLNQLFIHKGCELPKWTWQVYEHKEKSAKKRRIQSQFDGSPICFSKG